MQFQLSAKHFKKILDQVPNFSLKPGWGKTEGLNFQLADKLLVQSTNGHIFIALECEREIVGLTDPIADFTFTFNLKQVKDLKDKLKSYDLDYTTVKFTSFKYEENDKAMEVRIEQGHGYSSQVYQMVKDEYLDKITPFIDTTRMMAIEREYSFTLDIAKLKQSFVDLFKGLEKLSPEDREKNPDIKILKSGLPRPVARKPKFIKISKDKDSIKLSWRLPFGDITLESELKGSTALPMQYAGLSFDYLMALVNASNGKSITFRTSDYHGDHWYVRENVSNGVTQFMAIMPARV